MTTASGHATASFIVSPTLTSQNSYITEVKNNIATVIVPDLGTIKEDLNGINATVVEIDGNVATIQTDIGTMKTDVSNIDGIVMGLEDDTATIGDTTTNTYWFSIIAAVLAGIATVVAIIILMLVSRKPKPQP
jgi:ABC-type Fe3+-siderophore transport system permease subunit